MSIVTAGLFLLAGIGLAAPPMAAASPVIVTEDWTGDNGDPWPDQWLVTGDTSAAFIQTNRGRVQGSSGVEILARLDPEGVLDTHITDSTQQVIFRASHSTSGRNAGLIARSDDDAPDTYYLAGVHLPRSGGINWRSLRIARVVDGNVTNIANAGSNHLWDTGTDQVLRFVVEQLDEDTTRLSLYLWVDGDAMPALPALTVDDSTAAFQGLAGRVGIHAQTIVGGRNFDFDDYVAEGFVIPEPATMSLLGLASLALLRTRRR